MDEFLRIKFFLSKQLRDLSHPLFRLGLDYPVLLNIPTFRSIKDTLEHNRDLFFGIFRDQIKALLHNLTFSGPQEENRLGFTTRRQLGLR